MPATLSPPGRGGPWAARPSATPRAGCSWAPPSHLVGRSPAVLVLAGFVNGFFPSRDYFDATVMTPDKQKLARATDIRRLYAAAGKPTERLVASWFTSIDLVGAEQLKLEIGRVRLRRGERIATTSPSIYLKEIEPTEDQSA